MNHKAHTACSFNCRNWSTYQVTCRQSGSRWKC